MDTISDLLMLAIYENDLNFVNYCLEKGVPVNRICKNGMTHLGAAAQTGNLQILRILLDYCRGVINVTENDNASLNLDFSGNRRRNLGYFVVCKEFDDSDFGEGPTPDGMEALEWDTEALEDGVKDESPVTPEGSLYKWYAKILNQTSVILKSPDNDIARLDRHGQNVLHHAIISGNEEAVAFLVDNFTEIGVNQCNGSWFSPLHLAVIHRNVNVIKYLVARNANVNNASCRQTPLHFAAERGYCEIVNLLIENGAYINAFDLEERSPLTLAIMNSKEEAAKLLIRKGATLNHEEVAGYTVLFRAVSNGLTATTRLLLESGAKIVQSHFLLHLAIRIGSFEIVKMLVKYGMFLNLRNEVGFTPLMSACSQANFDVAKYLLDHGASANTLNHINYMSALHICVRDINDSHALDQFIELLVDHNANLNANSHQGNVLFFAIMQAKFNAASLLVKHGVDVNLREERAYYDTLSLARRYGNLYLVQLIVFAGFRFENSLLDVRALSGCKVRDPVDAFLVSAVATPLSLRELCRIRIRETLGRGLVRKVSVLPLPKFLQAYLTLDIL